MPETFSPSLSMYAESLPPRIDRALHAYCELGQGCPERLREAIDYALLSPGKRLRPMLALLAAEACGGSCEAAMPAACAVEMVHAYSLVHDDLPAMDDDDLRRGRPTCHKAFGEATAILAGDALLTMAFETLAKGVQPPAVAAACCAALAEAAGACQLVGGQADDVAGLACTKRGLAPSHDSPILRKTGCGEVPVPVLGRCHGEADLVILESIHNRKTGAMIRVSLRLGAMTAGAAPAQLRALDEYGRRLGLAFQITDDLLDVRGSESATGKRVGKDAQCGKLTFPGLLGVDQSARRAQELIAEACQAILPLVPRADGLEALAQWVLERNR